MEILSKLVCNLQVKIPPVLVKGVRCLISEFEYPWSILRLSRFSPFNAK